MGLFVLMLDSTVINVALPDIARDLDATTAALQWVVNAYLLVMESLVVTAGRLGDIVGRRRVFLIGDSGGGRRRLEADDVERLGRPGEASERELAERLGDHERLGRRVHALADEDLTRLGRGAQALREDGHAADRGVVRAAL